MEYARALLPDGEAWHSRKASWDAVGGLVEQFEAVHLPDSPESEAWYGWEPLPLLDFVEGITLAGDARPGKGRFLDVGSGIGSKLVIAAALGWRPEGLERHAPYASVSRRLFDVPVIVGEALAFADYGDFELVYCYRLAKRDELQERLNARIVDQLRPGALFWCIGPPWPEGLEHVGGHVWVK